MKIFDNITNKIQNVMHPDTEASVCVDNWVQIAKLLKFEETTDFYMLQIIKRRKENPELQGNCKALRTIYITSVDQFMDLEATLKAQAMQENARIYINLNVKSMKKAMGATLAEMAKRFTADDYHKPYRIFDACAGKLGAVRNPTWVIDIDWADALPSSSDDERQAFLATLMMKINSYHPVEDKCVDIIPTVNGFHLITAPFNPQELSEEYPFLIVHKNNPTLLFYKSF